MLSPSHYYHLATRSHLSHDHIIILLRSITQSTTTTTTFVLQAGYGAHRTTSELGRLFRNKSRLFQQSQDAASRAVLVRQLSLGQEKVEQLAHPESLYKVGNITV